MKNQLPKRLFHGTTSNNLMSLRQGIDVNVSGANPRPDFGKGFYLTSQSYQAERQAVRKTNLYNRLRIKAGSNDLVHPIVCEYELTITEEQIKSNCKIFDKPDEEWGNFVLSNRLLTDFGELHNIDQNIPLVYGPLADGKPNIGVLLGDFKKGIISREEVIQGMKPMYKGNNYQDQLSVHTQTAAEWLILKDVKEVR